MRLAWGVVPDGTPRRETAWRLIGGLLPGARLSNPCVFCGGPHGAVRVSGADAVASTTYAGGFAVVAVEWGARAIGVDAEVAGGRGRFDTLSDRSYPVPEPVEGSGLARVLGPRATLRDWVRVEAVLKADGRGLRADPTLVDIRPADDAWVARVTDRAAEYTVQDVDGPPGLIVAVALRAG